MVGVAALLLSLGQSMQQAAGDLKTAVRNLESVGVVTTAFCPFFFFPQSCSIWRFRKTEVFLGKKKRKCQFEKAELPPLVKVGLHTHKQKLSEDTAGGWLKQSPQVVHALWHW